MKSALPIMREAVSATTEALENMGSTQLDEIRAIIMSHGAILLRGYSVDSTASFSQAVALIGGQPVPYVDGTSPRKKLDGNVYTSTEHPADSSIALHNEQSYCASWPAKLFFCCVIPAQSGGHTLLGDSAAVLQGIDQTVRSMFAEKGVMYVRNLPGGESIGLSWQTTFETDDRAVAEAYCLANGIEFRWKTDGTLQLITKRPATAIHRGTGREVWFNQADLFHPSSNSPEIYAVLMELYGQEPFDLPQYACFGDGTPIPDTMLDHVREVAKQHTFQFDWNKGDLLVIDNMLISHGRSPYTGNRKILVAMTD